MIYINLIIIVLFALLALLSRKHYSKYKKLKGLRGCFVAFWLSMGECVWLIIEELFHLEGLKSRLMDILRKTQIVSPKKLVLLTQELVVRNTAVALGILFTFNFIEMSLSLNQKLLKDGENIVEREEYGGDVRQEEIIYEVEGQEETYVLDVSPVRLSEEEFYDRADEVADGIEEKYFKQGSLISHDIELPLSDEENVFSISWISEAPQVISSRGRLKEEEVSVTSQVSFRMIIEYYDYSAEYRFHVAVGPAEKSERNVVEESIGQALSNLEKESVGEKEFVLPQEVDGTRIQLKNKQRKGGKALLMGIMFSIAIPIILVSRVKERVAKRDEELMKEYPFFVDSLWLHIQTGMNIKRALTEYAHARDDTVLVREIKYTLNHIDTGMAEYSAYEELGVRLGIPIYVTLMRHISQNLKMGTKDLRLLMENEVEIALKSRKESARKKGEEASTKLVFPMIILLVVVMIIVMTPAFMGF